MPSTRRLKTVVIALAIIICTVWYLSNDSSSQEFYSRTVTALDKKAASDREVNQKLQVKDTANTQEPIRAPSPQKPLTGDSTLSDSSTPKYPKKDDSGDASTKATQEGGKSVAGRKIMKDGENKGSDASKETPSKANDQEVKDGDDTGDTEKPEENKEDHEVETELNSILKRGPIIIFSKSYCPHSAKAKNILLEKYKIVPAPFVVELDTHPLGQGLQAALLKSTGRRTVPNVLVNGRSIGGGDDIQALDESGGLVDKVKNMGGKRIMEAKLS